MNLTMKRSPLAPPVAAAAPAPALAADPAAAPAPGPAAPGSPWMPRRGSIESQARADSNAFLITCPRRNRTPSYGGVL